MILWIRDENILLWGKTFHCVERLVWCVPQSLALCQDKYSPCLEAGQAAGISASLFLPRPRRCRVLFQVITVTLRGKSYAQRRLPESARRADRTKPPVWGLFQVVCFAFLAWESSLELTLTDLITPTTSSPPPKFIIFIQVQGVQLKQ